MLRVVVGQAGVPLVLGLGSGRTGAWVLSRSLASVLYGVEANDPATLVAVSVALNAAGGISAILPARRAVRIDPMRALREE